MIRLRSSAAPLFALALLLAALLLAAGWLWTRDTRRGLRYPPYSVHRTDDRGAALLFRLYRRLGLRPQVWDRDLSALRRPGTLLLFLPPERLFGSAPGELLPHEIEALDAWVRAGNVAVLFAEGENPVFRALGLRLAPMPRELGAALHPAQPGPLAEGVRQLRGRSHLRFQLEPEVRRAGGASPGEKKGAGKPLPPPPPPIPPLPEGAWVELFARRQGEARFPQVVAAARGQGLYVAASDPSLATNLGLVAGDNARFMVNVARLTPPGGVLWLDEYHKRQPDRHLIGYLRERALLPALLYALAWLGLLLWRENVRFGAPEPLASAEGWPGRPLAARGRGGRLGGLAALYRNAGLARHALAAVEADLRRRLAAALRLERLEDREAFLTRYAARTGRSPESAWEALREVRAVLERGGLEEAEALRLGRKLAEIDRALQERTAPAPARAGAAAPETEGKGERR